MQLRLWLYGPIRLKVVFLLHSYPLTIPGQCKFPSHFLSSYTGNFQVFLVDSSLILTDICENAQLNEMSFLTRSARLPGCHSILVFHFVKFKTLIIFLYTYFFLFDKPTEGPSIFAREKISHWKSENTNQS